MTNQNYPCDTDWGAAECIMVEEPMDLSLTEELLDIMLQDRATGENLRWATDEYAAYGEAYAPGAKIMQNLIVGDGSVPVLPRVLKDMEEWCTGMRLPAEVFRPAWMCNETLNRHDAAWFGRQDVFNTPAPDHTWRATPGQITFPPGKSWKEYVARTCVEKGCGEAQHLVSRYDSVSGDFIPLLSRIGLLDRKLRVVSENAQTEEEWFRMALLAFQSSYGCEYQGDNVLLARENLLWTFDDYCLQFCAGGVSEEQRRQIIEVISWNIWQMPPDASPSTRCKIQLWQTDAVHTFHHPQGELDKIFDVVVGNTTSD